MTAASPRSRPPPPDNDTALEERVAAAEAELLALDADLLALDGRVDALEANLTSDLAGLDARVSALEGDSGGNITLLEARVAVNEADIASLDGRLTTAEADTAATGARVDVLEANLTSAIVTLGERVTTNEGDIAAIDGRVTANEGDIVSLDGRVSANEVGLAQVDDRYRATTCVRLTTGKTLVNGVAELPFIFNSVSFASGNSTYDTSTGVFTHNGPTTEFYLVTAALRVSFTSSGYVRIWIISNGDEIYNEVAMFGAGFATPSVTIIVSVPPGGTITLNALYGSAADSSLVGNDGFHKMCIRSVGTSY